MRNKKISVSEQLTNALSVIAKMENEAAISKRQEVEILEAFSRILRGADTDYNEGYFGRQGSTKNYRSWMDVTADVGKLLAKDSYEDLKRTIAGRDEEIKNLNDVIRRSNQDKF